MTSKQPPPDTESPVVYGPPPRPRSSELLRQLLVEYGEEGIAAQGLINRLGNRSVLLTCLIFSLPLAVVPVPGVASIPALIIMLLAARMAAGLPPKLPRRLREWHISPRLLRAVATASARVLATLERWTRQSLTWLTDSRALRRSHAGFIALAGAIMALPMPVPFANGIPAWWIIFLTVGVLERDGRFIVVGYVLYFLGLAYIVGFLIGGGAAIYEVLDWMRWV